MLGLNGTHTFINDLDFNLQSPRDTLVQIMARSCGSEDNFNLNLDDEAEPGSWPCPPPGGGPYRPSNPLSAFDGKARNGAVKSNAAALWDYLSAYLGDARNVRATLNYDF